MTGMTAGADSVAAPVTNGAWSGKNFSATYTMTTRAAVATRRPVTVQIAPAASVELSHISAALTAGRKFAKKRADGDEPRPDSGREYGGLKVWRTKSSLQESGSMDWPSA